jgi:hypothetical protein
MQIEVITEFRRLVIIAEEHVQRGDWMFTRGVRAAQEAVAPLRGLIVVKARIRFSPLNTFIEPPRYEIAIGGASTPKLDVLHTEVTPEYSVPLKDKDRKTLSALLGATLEGKLDAASVGQTTRIVAIVLNGQESGRTTVDFASLE